MIVLRVIFFLFGLATLTAARGDHNTHLCYSCNGISDPSSCNVVENCKRGEHCGARVSVVHGIQTFDLGCFEGKICHDHIVVAPAIGKRQHDIPCFECCDTGHCNRGLCSAYAPTQTPDIVTGSNQHQLGTCVDHTEDGFSCDLFDKLTMCTETDPTKYSYTVAHSKCPQYCGLCDIHGNHVKPIGQTVAPTDQVTVTGSSQLGPCVDQTGYTCDLFDKRTICSETDPTKYSYTVAHSKCPQFCGFCDSNGNYITSSPTVAPTDTVIVASTQIITPIVTSGAVVVDPVTATTSTTAPVDLVTPTDAECFDDEKNGLVCANFDQFNFCTDTTNFAHAIALTQCRKHCGLCTGVAPAVDGTVIA